MRQSDRRVAIGQRLRLGTQTWARMLWARLWRSLHMEWWFPHVPLALAIGIAGLLQLLPVFGSLQSLISVIPVPVSDLGGLSVGFKVLAIRGVSQELLGGLLTLLSVGLLWRSRLAWVLTILMTAASLALQILSHSTFSNALIALRAAVQN